MVVSGRNHRVEIRFLSTKMIPLAHVLNTRRDLIPVRVSFCWLLVFDADIMIWKEGNGGQWSERGSTSSAPCMIVTPSKK